MELAPVWLPGSWEALRLTADIVTLLANNKKDVQESRLLNWTKQQQQKNPKKLFRELHICSVCWDNSPAFLWTKIQVYFPWLVCAHICICLSPQNGLHRPWAAHKVYFRSKPASVLVREYLCTCVHACGCVWLMLYAGKTTKTWRKADWRQHGIALFPSSAEHLLFLGRVQGTMLLPTPLFLQSCLMSWKVLFYTSFKAQLKHLFQSLPWL